MSEGTSPPPKSTTTPPAQQGGDRPFPIPPRDPQKLHVFALIVGINDYKGRIPKLNGCLNDVKLVEDYLRDKFVQEENSTEEDTPETNNEQVALETNNEEATSETNTEEPPNNEPSLPIEVDGRLHLCKLTDSQATYDNIIKGFREFLSQATQNDTVWFHFSGHGAEQFSAIEFEQQGIDVTGKDQTLVCYRAEGDTTSQQFLADKELAVLLSELKKNPHIVVSLDACHSGSGTRELLEPSGLKTRTYKHLVSATREDAALLPDREQVRTLASYLDGYYDTLNKEGDLDIPTKEHVVLSACESKQTAGDLAAGGVFTTSLIDTLKNTKGDINYARLFSKVRSKANKKRNAQNPQFGSLAGFDPYTSFLKGQPMVEIPEAYEVFSRGDNWFVHCGAIHGLPTDSNENIKLMIISDDKSVNIGATIKKVGAQHSKITFMDGKPEGEPEDYYAEILSMPAKPIYVRLDVDQKASTEIKAKIAELQTEMNALEAELESLEKPLNDLKAEWDASKNILFIDEENEGETPLISIEAIRENAETNEFGYMIRNAQTGKEFVSVPVAAGSPSRLIELTKTNINKIGRWQRTIELDNPKTKIRDMFDFELEVFDKNDDKIPVSGTEAKIYVSEENLRMRPNGNGFLGINFRVTMKNDQQDLFVYAFDLSSSCAIRFRNDEEKVLRPSEMNIGESMSLRTRPYGWGLGPDDDGAVRWFKVFVATEEIDYHQLTQPGLVGDKDVEDDEWEEQISEDWCTETIKVVLVREKGEIPQDGEEKTLNEGLLRIKGHDGVSGTINLASAEVGARSSDPANKLAIFEMQGHQMIDFNSARDTDSARQNVLEITNLNVEEEDLENHPLEIVLADKLADDELLVPIAFDGENFRVIGTAEADGDETLIKITDLPEVDGDGENPFGDEPADRSLFGALKMAFFKLVFKKTDQNYLRYISFKEDGSIARDDVGINEKVADAKNILLLVHGLIGNTEDIAADVVSIKGADGTKVKDYYDLILTFDYENLNTPIQATANKLKLALEDVGITEDDGKRLTVMASSMGGLVSRFFIEQKEGNKVVDRLVMVGTPNNGSNFGKLSSAVKFAKGVLDIAANFVPNLLPFAGYFLKATSKILVTLGQMDPDAKPEVEGEKNFLDTLNGSADPNVPYTILGGDVAQYMEENKDRKGIEKLMKRVGDLVNTGEQNDIAVQVDSIMNKEVWETRNPKATTALVACHHLNYFSSEQGREGLGKLLIPQASE